MLKIAMLAPNRLKYSETFIHAAFRNLEGEKHLLYGDPRPTHFTRVLESEGDALLWEPKLDFWTRILGRPDPKRLADRLELAMLDYLVAKKIDVVLAQFGSMGVAALDVCKVLKLPLVVHFHGFDAFRADALENNGPRYPELFAYASAVVGVSREMCSQLIQLGAPAEQVHFRPYGIDTDFFQFGDRPEGAPVFLTVGRFVAKKRPDISIRAFAGCLEVLPEARLVMLGDGALLADCQRLAAELGVAEAIDFRGKASPEEVRDAMQGARALLQHSSVAPDGDREGTPLCVLEACASGLPVIGTRHAGIPDVVGDGESGILIEELDVEGMIAAMVRLGQNRGLATQMGKQGRAIVEANYALQGYIQGLQALLSAQVPVPEVE